MKKVHLLCNAHLDPAWLWRWNEGLAEAISTFRVAADFCEQYDGFVFNHNESLLYEWVEEYEPALFERIKKLVKDGKWKIMGGWYLQPDCNMPSPESFLSQIDIGREYFKEKFGVTPTTAINFDPFGHTRGLVQIMAKKGFKNYVFMRPGEYTRDVLRGNFLWEGYDGSTIIAHGMYGGYNTQKGLTVERIKNHINSIEDDTILCLWGVGNHGGGPSRVDIEAIAELAKATEHTIIHSNCDDYFAEVDAKNLETVSRSLTPSMVGCYTSMVRIKQGNRRLENKIALTEKIMSYAEMQSDIVFDYEELKKAKKALAFCQFHDILPGSAIKSVENDSLQTLAYGEEIADRLYTRAFIKLCEGQKKAEEGTIPILIFNPHPFEIEDEFEVGFMLQNQNWNEDEVTLATVYDERGNRLLSQNEKPDCTFNLDWIEKVSFRGKLAPASITRFNAELTVRKKQDLSDKAEYSDQITVKNEKMSFVLDRKTGLIKEYKIGGKSLIKNSGVLEVYKDNEDPWGMNVTAFDTPLGEFELMTDLEANEFVGYPDEKIPNVRVIEDGEVRIKIQSFFKFKSNKAIVEYTVPKNGIYVDLNFKILSNEPNVMIKYRLDTDFSGTPYGQQAFGVDEMFFDGTENVFQKWCGIKGEASDLCVLNVGSYAGSFAENKIYLSLLRTPIYSAHPIRDRQIAPHNRFSDHIDMGEREFSFRLTNFENADKKAQVFNEKPQAMSFFPSGMGDKKQPAAIINNENVLLSSIRKQGEKYQITLYNYSDCEQSATLCLTTLDKKITENFKGYEFKIIEI